MNGMLHLCLNSAFLFYISISITFSIQKIILVLLGSFCGSRRVRFRTCKSFGSFGAYLLRSNQHMRDWWGVLQYVGLSNKFLKLYIWQKLFIASSVGSELKSPNRRKLSYFDECESISVLIHFKYPLILVLWGL